MTLGLRITVLESISTDVRRNLSMGGRRQHAVYPFQVADDATAMDVCETLYPCYVTKKIPHVTATVAKNALR